MIQRLAISLTAYINNNQKINDEQNEKIRYVLEVILSELLKLIALVTIFLLLGKLTYFLFSLTILILIRTFSGGIHFDKSMSCFIFSKVFFIISALVMPNIPNQNETTYYIIAIISILIIAIRSPSPSINRPIINKKRRYFLKIFSILATTGCLYVLFFYINSPSLFKCGLGTIFLQSIQLISIKKREVKL